MEKQGIIEEKNRLKTTSEYIKIRINGNKGISLDEFLRFYSFAATWYTNKDAGYYKIYEFLELLQKVRVDTSEQELVDVVIECINELRKKCMIQIYLKNPKKMENAVNKYINRLEYIIEHQQIYFHEYKEMIKEYLKVFLMEIKTIDYNRWIQLLLKIDPKCTTTEEINKVANYKQLLYKKGELNYGRTNKNNSR